MRPISMATLIAAVTASASCWSQSSEWTLSPADLDSAAEVKALSDSVATALDKCETVALRFRPGTYRGVRLFVDDRGRPHGCNAGFSLDSAGSGTVLFEGQQQPKFIDIVTNRPSFAGTIRNIEVRNYMNGIAVTRTSSRKGERVRWAAETAGVKAVGPGLTIANVGFTNVGDWDPKPGSATGWGAIVFNFTHNNRALGNRFEGLGNTVESPLMHALYLVGSSGNLISDNYFGAMDGAAIKLRNRSDNNRIENNSFRHGGEPLLQLWFCNQSKRGEANCPANECPSINTVFVNNRILVSQQRDRSRRGGGPVPVTNPFVSYEREQGLRLVERFYVGAAGPKGCPAGAAAPVIRGGGNALERTR